MMVFWAGRLLDRVAGGQFQWLMIGGYFSTAPGFSLMKSSTTFRHPLKPTQGKQDSRREEENVVKQV